MQHGTAGVAAAWHVAHLVTLLAGHQCPAVTGSGAVWTRGTGGDAAVAHGQALVQPVLAAMQSVLVSHADAAVALGEGALIHEVLLGFASPTTGGHGCCMGAWPRQCDTP
jgi:hypothetical protein